MMPLFAKTEYAKYTEYVSARPIGRAPVGTELFSAYAEYPGGGAGVCPHCGNTLLIEAINCRQIVCSVRQVNPHPSPAEIAAWKLADPAGEFGCYAELRM